MSSRVRLRVLLLAGTALTAPSFAQELPTSPDVAAGSVAVSTPSAGAMTVTQSTQQAIVNWQSFSIGEGGSVVFQQPNGQSVILNRVTGAATTSIAGQLGANGQVYIVNPNGIAITSSGTVNTGGFVASTLGITDQDFLAGKAQFTGNGNSAAVSNAGSINVVPGGYAALIGGQVDNSGMIVAPLGKVGLGAGERATLDFSGDGFLQVAVPSDGDNEDLISHSGTISADGGAVIMSAAAAQDAARRVVNLSGVVEARTVSGRSGAITLGGGGGQVVVSGRLDVSAPEPVAPPVPQPRPASVGGSVTVTGEHVVLAGATIDASGVDGGGDVRIGGDYQGGGDLPRAAYLDVDGETVIYADATGDGDGGSVILWSDLVTNYEGLISGRGAGQGDGGFVEVSGKVGLAYKGFADLRAENGSYGNLLLDPFNITISTAPTNYIPGVTSNINNADLEAQLNAANVTYSTAGAGADPGNISVGATVTWGAPTTLTLIADNDIVINRSLTANAGGVVLQAGGNIGLVPTDSSISTAIVTGAPGLTMTAGGSIVDAGVPGLGPASFLTSGGTISLTAGTGIALQGQVAAFNVDMLTTAGDLIAPQITADGNILLRAPGGQVGIGGFGPITSNNATVVIEAQTLNNTGGPGAISTPPGDGRFLIYLDTWTGNTLGGLTGSNLYNRTYALNGPGTIGGGDTNYFIYEAQPTITFTAPNGTRVYYDPATGLGAPTYNPADLINGDTFAEAIGGAPVVTDTTAPGAGVGTYAETVVASGYTSLIGYAINYVNGDMTVTPAPLTITASDLDKYFGQTLTFTGTEFTSSGLRGADSVTSVALSSAGAAASAPIEGSPYSILASSAAGTGLANYTISYAPGLLTVVAAPPPPPPPPPAPEPSPDFPGSVFTGAPIVLDNPADDLPGGLMAEVTADDARLSLQILEQRSQEFENDIAACQLQLEQDADANAFIDCASDALEAYGAAIDDPLIQLPPELQATVSVIRQTVQRMRTAAANPNSAEAVAEARAAVGDLVDFVREQTALVRAVEPETEALLVEHGNVMAGAVGQLDIALVGAVEI